MMPDYVHTHAMRQGAPWDAESHSCRRVSHFLFFPFSPPSAFFFVRQGMQCTQCPRTPMRDVPRLDSPFTLSFFPACCLPHTGVMILRRLLFRSWRAARLLGTSGSRLRVNPPGCPLVSCLEAVNQVMRILMAIRSNFPSVLVFFFSLMIESGEEWIDISWTENGFYVAFTTPPFPPPYPDRGCILSADTRSTPFFFFLSP